MNENMSVSRRWALACSLIASLVAPIDGWNVGLFFGDRAIYNGDWLKQAAAAKGGIFGNSAVEAMYPQTRILPSEESMDGSKHNYTLTSRTTDCLR
jgi:hypothetical protein